jgi:nucleoside-diphosphate kinase
VVALAVYGVDAIALTGLVGGAPTPPAPAPGTIRKDFAESIEANSVHGSDAPETAAQEIAFFFAGTDIVG